MCVMNFNWLLHHTLLQNNHEYIAYHYNNTTERVASYFSLINVFAITGVALRMKCVTDESKSFRGRFSWKVIAVDGAKKLTVSCMR